MILYKYYGYNSGLAALKSSQLGFRTPEKFNDPFELTYLDNIHETSGPELISQQWRDSLRTLRSSVGVLSLTRTPTNPLMWAHYGEDHTGFVIGYDVSSEFFTGSKYNLVSVDQGDVIYTSSKEPLSLTINMKDQLTQVFLASRLSTIPLQKTRELATILRRVFLIKPSCWSYEEEVRVVKMIDDYSMTVEERHLNALTRNRPLGREVAPGHSVVTVEGLRIFEHRVPIKEVYLGLRNPLIDNTPYPDNQFSQHDDALSHKAELEKWKVSYLDMKTGSWDLKVNDAPYSMLDLYPSEGEPGSSLSTTLQKLQEASAILKSNDVGQDEIFELSEWYGQVNVRLKGRWL
jgi:hypothetical protein